MQTIVALDKILIATHFLEVLNVLFFSYFVVHGVLLIVELIKVFVTAHGVKLLAQLSE